MSLLLQKASTSDALTLNGMSKRAFDSDVNLGGPSSGGPPRYMSVPFHTKMARQGHLYKLTEDGLIVGGVLVQDVVEVDVVVIRQGKLRLAYLPIVRQRIA